MTQAAVSQVFPSPKHDHSQCIDVAIQGALEAFRRHGISFTPLREKVFREIAASHRAIGAYEILDRLAGKGARLAPISVYRAIDVLLQVGIVRRFKSRNAFYASQSAEPMSPRIVLACEKCGLVADADGIQVFQSIKRAAALDAFAPKSAIIEVFGHCAHCAAITAGTGRSRRHGTTG
jgi:Fur family zinc uptake transcriptional regulator